jgi:hypothetical protein
MQAVQRRTAFSESARIALRLSARAAAATGAYVIASAAILLTVIGLRGLGAPSLSRSVLAFIFVASLAAGLDPATSRAALLTGAGGGDPSPRACLFVGALKGLLASPFLVIVWRFADPSIDLATLACTPLLAVTGFCATDLRVLLDVQGRHALAIALKQGSLAAGIVLLGLLVLCKVPLSWAAGISTAARLAPLAPALLRGAPGASVQRFWSEVRGLLTDRRWVELAAVSVIGAASGSADRLFGLRYLTATAYGGYYLTYELFSKFWLIPYLLSPIQFARRVVGEDRRFARGAWLLTAAAGAAFVLCAGGLLAFAPALLERVIGASFGVATMGFAAAVVISAFAQLHLARLQGSGRSREAMAAISLGALLSVPLFFTGASFFGARGLMWAWLAKATIELAALMAAGRRGTIAGRSARRRAGLSGPQWRER